MLWIVAKPWIAPASAGDGRLHVTFIDVGQGDAALVRFPNGSTLLVDAGGLPGASPFDIGDRIVAPVLRHGGIRRLDSVALTHGDVDHIGGADAILTEFRPADVWEGIPVPPHETLRALQRTAGRVGAAWTNVQTNDMVTIDGVQVLVRHPALADWQRQDVRNDDSIVLEIIWRDVSIVLTGDIGSEAERLIAPLFSPSPLRIVKVPHHGSLTSSSLEFVRALSPQAAVVSVGRSNTFGHPAPEVIDRYRRIGADVFRTDQDGAVSMSTDGYVVDIQTFTGRRTFLRNRFRHEAGRRGQAVAMMLSTNHEDTKDEQDYAVTRRTRRQRSESETASAVTELRTGWLQAISAAVLRNRDRFELERDPREGQTDRSILRSALAVRSPGDQLCGTRIVLINFNVRSFGGFRCGTRDSARCACSGSSCLRGESVVWCALRGFFGVFVVNVMRARYTLPAAMPA